MIVSTTNKAKPRAYISTMRKRYPRRSVSRSRNGVVDRRHPRIGTPRKQTTYQPTNSNDRNQNAASRHLPGIPARNVPGAQPEDCSDKRHAAQRDRRPEARLNGQPRASDPACLPTDHAQQHPGEHQECRAEQNPAWCAANGKEVRLARCVMNFRPFQMPDARCARTTVQAENGSRRRGPLNALFAPVTAMSLSIPAAAASASIQ